MDEDEMASPAPVARVEQGDLVGISEGGVACFRGIPFAAPPVGALRWRAPQPPAAWTGQRDATRFGAVCPQPASPDGAAADARLASLPQSEDCLTLNVWTTARAGEKRAVMVWIHGGAGRIGYAAKPVYDGTSFARRGIVFVSFNYRLGHLGTFAPPPLVAEAGGEPFGNYALMDQIAALGWVKRNVAAFGGDPDNLTVFGQSAGGESVLFLLTSPGARGLFAKAIVQSGGGGGGWRSTRTLAEQTAADGALLARISASALSPAALRTLPVERLMPGRLDLFSPFIDGALVTEAPVVTLQAGRAQAVPLIVGSNSDEALSLFGRFGLQAEQLLDRVGAEGRALYAAEGSDAATRARRVMTDMQFTMPARMVARAMSGIAPVWCYEFRYVAEAKRRPGAGVAHEDDIPFVFDNLAHSGSADLTSSGVLSGRLTADTSPESTLTAQDRAAARRVNGCWAAFAQTGAPVAEAGWPRFERPAEAVLLIDEQDAVRERFRQAQLDFVEASNARLNPGHAPQ